MKKLLVVGLLASGSCVYAGEAAAPAETAVGRLTELRAVNQAKYNELVTAYTAKKTTQEQNSNAIKIAENEKQLASKKEVELLTEITALSNRLSKLRAAKGQEARKQKNYDERLEKLRKEEKTIREDEQKLLEKAANAVTELNATKAKRREAKGGKSWSSTLTVGYLVDSDDEEENNYQAMLDSRK